MAPSRFQLGLGDNASRASSTATRVSFALAAGLWSLRWTALTFTLTAVRGGSTAFSGSTLTSSANTVG